MKSDVYLANGGLVLLQLNDTDDLTDGQVEYEDLTRIDQEHDVPNRAMELDFQALFERGLLVRISANFLIN